ncbi:MAG: DnaT-like ssDNA-binding protein [Dehalococcoidales bacterium]
MSFIVENGTGVLTANALATVAFVTTYLTDRGRETENSWSTSTTAAQQAAIIAATDYIEGKYRDLFKGRKEFRALTLAKGTLTFSDNPLDTETVTIGSQTYTFLTVLIDSADNVLIGDNASDSIDNLINAILATAASEGVTHGTGTVAHTDVTAEDFDGDTMVAEANDDGAAGNLIVTTTTVTNGAWSGTTLIGGSDVGKRQPLSFPRLDLFDRDSIRILGMPDRLKQAVSEYAVRHLSATLRPDPDVDDTGAEVIKKREKVGPIEEETGYRTGGRIATAKPYPAADALLQEFLLLSGVLLRA